jgi:AraC family transcriptional activator of mtrCDE
MDPLTHLIELLHPQAALELRCLLQGRFAIDHATPAPHSVSFHLVLGGSCVIEAAHGARIAMQAGDFLLFPKGGAHRIFNADGAGMGAGLTVPVIVNDSGMLPMRRNGAGAGDAEVDLLCGRFDFAHDAAAVVAMFPDPLHVCLTRSHAVATLQTLVELMRAESQGNQNGALAIVTALCQALFAMALRACGEVTVHGASVLGLVAHPRLGPSVQAFLHNPARPWSIAELASVAAMSRATYARQFQAASGVSVARFLAMLRMTIAGGLLRTTPRSAADIGAGVGYQSEAAFGKAFQKQFGRMPGQYRRHHAAPAPV